MERGPLVTVKCWPLKATEMGFPSTTIQISTPKILFMPCLVLTYMIIQVNLQKFKLSYFK